MKRFLALLIILSLPAGIFVSVFQYYSYTFLQDEIVQLEEEQEERIEKNKRAVAGIAVYNSPQRIGKLVPDLGLIPIESGKIIQIRVAGQRSGQDG